MILKISYSDDLKIPHQFIDNNQTVSLVASSQSQDRERGVGAGGLGVFGAILGGGVMGRSSSGISTIIILAAIAAAIVIATLYIIRRKRSRSKLRKLQASKTMSEDPFLDNDT